LKTKNDKKSTKKHQASRAFPNQGIGQETAEKQAPSALEFLGHFHMAMEAQEKSIGKRVPLFQCLNFVISEYNRGTSVRKWKVDGNKKKLIGHLLRCPIEVPKILAVHYDQHKHSCSGRAQTMQCIIDKRSFSFIFLPSAFV